MPTERTSESDRRFTKDTTNDSNRAYAAMRRAAGAVSAPPFAHPDPYDTRAVRAASQPWFDRKT